MGKKLKWLLIGFSWLSPAFGQGTGPAPSRVTEGKPVYVVDFDVSEPGQSTHAAGFFADGKFPATLIALRLRELAGVEVHRISKPPCVARTSPAEPKSDLIQVGPWSAAVPLPRDFQAIQGTVVIRADQWVLSYRLTEYHNCEETPPLLERSQSFAEDAALENLTGMADVLAFRLAENPVVSGGGERLDIQTIGEWKEGAKEQEIQGRLASYLFLRLSESREFQPRLCRAGSAQCMDGAAYRAEVHLQFNRTTRFIFGPSRIRSIEAEFLLGQKDPATGAERTYTVGPTVLSLENDDSDARFLAFYQEAARSAADALIALKAGSYAGLKQQLTDQEAEQLLDRARELLQKGNPETAKAISQPLISKTSNALLQSDALRVQGQANLELRNYSEAAQAFDNALESARPEDRPGLLAQAGAAWYRAQNYREAAARFELSLRGQPRQPDTYVQLARSRWLLGQHVDAVTCLLDGLRETPESAALRDELEQQVGHLQIEEIKQVIKPLQQGNGQGVPVAEALTSAYLRYGEQLYFGADYAGAEQALRSAMDLHVNSYFSRIGLLLARTNLDWARSSNASLEEKTAKYQSAVGYLNEVLANNPKNIDAAGLLGLVCNDYLFDMDCDDRAAQLMDSAEMPKERVATTNIDIAEIDVIRGRYQTALGRLDGILITGALVDPYYMAVTHFYVVWGTLALGQESRADNAFRRWRDEMQEARRGKFSGRWVFNGARKALSSETRVSAEKKSVMLEMIEAMEDERGNLPETLGAN